MEKLNCKKRDIAELYNRGLSIKDISKKLTIHTSFIKNVLTNNNIEIRSRNFYRKKIKFNEDYFEKIDNISKAYFLGLLYADGNVYLKRNRVQIALKNEDSYILSELAKKLDYTGKLYIDRTKYTKLILSSIKMTKDLINLGCVPRKSLILKFPTKEQVPEHLQRHFIRGYFDGDGCISINNKIGYTVSFTGTESFCLSIVKIFKKLDIQCGNWRKRYKNKQNSVGSINHYENIYNDKIYNYFYNDSENLYLKRKFNKFKNDTI